MSGLVARDIRVPLGGREVLAGIDVAFAPGRITAVVGPNGAGKSTLLACLAGLRTPRVGTVTLDGAALATLSPRERARRIGWLPQSPEIAWAVDVRTFVGLGRTPHVGAWGLRAADDDAVEAALVRTGTDGFAARIVTTLSGGERARALLARALAGEPEWLLADEPMAGLDPGHALDAVALFRTLATEGGRGVIVTLHDLDVALRMADRVLVLAAGRVLAEGTPAEALTPEVLARAYGVEARLLDGVGGPLIEIVGRAA